VQKRNSLSELKFQSGSALRQLGQFLPRPLAKVSGADSRNETDVEKISEIIGSLDLDGNGAGSAWELHDWMLWVEKRVHQHIVEDQVSISPIFYEQLFHMKVFCATSMCLQFGFVIFGRRILAQKLLIKCW
jgi:hypothetical protein